MRSLESDVVDFNPSLLDRRDAWVNPHDRDDALFFVSCDYILSDGRAFLKLSPFRPIIQTPPGLRLQVYLYETTLHRTVRYIADTPPPPPPPPDPYGPPPPPPPPAWLDRNLVTLPASECVAGDVAMQATITAACMRMAPRCPRRTSLTSHQSTGDPA